MKLFQRIFATFCMVIICAIFVASFSVWLLQTRMVENHFQRTRTMEINLLSNALTTFQAQGEDATRNLLERWRSDPSAQNVIIITGDNKQDILGRSVQPDEVAHAYDFALKNPNSNLSAIYYDPFGEEYLFFIRDFDKNTVKPMPGLLIPGLSVAPVWHEFIILAVTLIVGLLLAYILASNISRPIRILEKGMNRLASGDLNARVSQQLDDRKDELASLGVHFDRMAAQLQKLVEKERHLLHHVSHEMRSPLARIQALLGLLHMQPQKQEVYLGKLESELTRMDALVGELLTLSRLETANTPLEKEPFALLPFLEQLVEDSQPVAQQNEQTVSLEVRGINPEARFNGNEGYLYRAFDNVIRNAMNYSPAGSTILLSCHEDRHHLHIEITDNGPGIREDQIPHIFTAFYRADSSANKPGTGLGLALARHIAEQHDGKILAENVSPSGLKIHFILPKTQLPGGKK